MLIVYILLVVIYNSLKITPRGLLFCGLVGYTGKNKVNLSVLKSLFVSNEARGNDSTGVFGTQRCRSLEKASDFVKTDFFVSSVKTANNVIGHTRSASRGTITKENAHPFRVGPNNDSLVGAHNGTLTYAAVADAIKEFNIKTDSDVDSVVIFKILYNNRKSNGELDFSVLQKVNGSMALTIIYRKLLYIYRRSTRPLHWGCDESGGIYYSSESNPLKALGLKSIRQFESDTLYVFKDGELIEMTKIKKPNSSGFEYSTSTYRNDYRRTNHQNCNIGRTQQTLALPAKTESQSEKTLAEYWSKVAISLANSTYTHILDNPEVYEIDLNYSNSQETTIFVNLAAFQGKKRLADLALWYVGVKSLTTGKESHFGITDDGGHTVLTIPNHVFAANGTTKVSITLVAQNPLIEDQQYFSSTFEINKGRVLEVTLQVPFRKLTKEAQSYAGLYDLPSVLDIYDSTIQEQAPESSKLHKLDTGRTCMGASSREAIQVNINSNNKELPEINTSGSKSCEEFKALIKPVNSFLDNETYEMYIEDWFDKTIEEILLEEQNTIGSNIRAHIWDLNSDIPTLQWYNDMLEVDIEKKEKYLKADIKYYFGSLISVETILKFCAEYALFFKVDDTLINVVSELTEKELIQINVNE